MLLRSGALTEDESKAAGAALASTQRAGSHYDRRRLLGMDRLPMAPSCALDEGGLSLQLERYRRVGQGAQLVEQTRHRLVVDLDERAESHLVDEAIAIERECCPFFTLDWEPARRRLTASVSQAEHEPSLDTIAFALGLNPSDRHAVSG